MGGAERVLFETIEVLKESGVDCYVLLPNEGELGERLRGLEVPYDIVRGGFWVTWEKPTLVQGAKDAINIAASIIPTLTKIRGSKCDIVYSNTLAICSGGIAAALLGRPHVWHLHEFPGYHGLELSFLKRFSFRLIRALSSACIVVSRHLAEICRPYLESAQLKVIYPSMHLACVETASSFGASVPARNGRFRCVIVGGLYESKRQEDAVQAVRQLHRDGADVELLAVGGGSPEYRRRLEEIVAANDLTDKVTFVGAVGDAAAFMQSSDVVLVCSNCETFGRVSIEAMMAGKPVIGARSAATPELIQDGVNGWLYEPGDFRDLATKIKRFYDDPLLARRLGENGQMWARKFFTKQRYAEELLSLLQPLNGRQS